MPGAEGLGSLGSPSGHTEAVVKDTVSGIFRGLMSEGKEFAAGARDFADEASDAASSATHTAMEGLHAAGDEVQSAVKAFGSPNLPPPPGSPLEASIKQLNFDLRGSATPASPATPLLPNSAARLGLSTAGPPPTAPGSATDAIDYDAFVWDTLLWSNKVRSGVYLVGGLLAVWAAHWALTSKVPLVTGVCWGLLLQLALNFGRAFMNPQLQAKCTYYDSAWTAGLISHIASSIKAAAALHDQHMNGSSAHKTLGLVALLWVVSLLGRAVGATTLAAALWVVAFTVPKLYAVYKKPVNQQVSQAWRLAKENVLMLDPRVRAALIIAPILAAGYTLSTVDLAIALFALVVYGRLCMAPSQVDKLNKAVAAPVMNTVSKVGNSMSYMANQAVIKFDLTPTPAKAKRA